MTTKHLKNGRYLPLIRLFSEIFSFSLGENFFLSYVVKMILTNILEGKKYGVVHTDSPISRDFLFLTIKLNCSDRIFPKNNM